MGSASALALVLGSVSALAEVTAAGVWTDWKAMLEAAGATVTVGSETAKGGTVALKDVAIAFEVPEATVTASIPQMTLADRGDASVAVTISPRWTVSISATPETGMPGEFTLSVVQAGLDLVIRGDDEAMRYDYQAESVLVTLDELIVDGLKRDADVRLGMVGLAGSYSLSGPAEARELVSELAADQLSMTAKASNPETRGKLTFAMDMADLVSSASGHVPVMLSMDDPTRALAAGMRSEGALSYGPVGFAFDFAESGQTTAGSGKVDGGTLEASLSADALRYATSSRGLSLKVSGSTVPVPEVELAMDEGTFGLTMPLAPASEPGDVALLLRYRGITASEGLWAMIDPMAILPRDPLTLVVDLTGKARWLVDILDPEATANLTAPPGEWTELALNELDVAGAGAQLTGSGAFTFDNGDLVTFQGMPRPTGAIDLRLVGANTLIDKLTQMGLITAEDAFGVRMMIGTIARPGDGADTLVSRIEVTPEGAILANGQPLPFP
jgi:hypothetical protein